EARVEMKRGRCVDRFNIDFSSPSNYSDAILIVEGENLHVGRQILAFHSSFFETLFYGSFKESNQPEITLQDVNIEDFTNLLKIIYRDEEALHCYWEGVLPLVDRFDMKHIRYEIEMLQIKEWVDCDYNREFMMPLAERYNLGFLL
ncbi:hypothetical protein PFISCL1PPCAC_20270, partial [Pristionchus fissidentatus]